MDGANEPGEADIVHDVLHGGEGFGDGRLVVERHGKASGELDQEAGQRNTPKTVEDVDVRGDIFLGHVVGKSLDFQALVEPFIDF